ncbi:hypothetical protein K488DRAFT_34910, partial [Vararia minispora EC-137]
SEYARGQLRSRDFVEFWYFTREGIKSAQAELSASQDIYSFFQTDGQVELRTANSSRASKAAVPDIHLSFSDITSSYSCFIREIREAKWPDDVVLSWFKFYSNLNNH